MDGNVLYHTTNCLITSEDWMTVKSDDADDGAVGDGDERERDRELIGESLLELAERSINDDVSLQYEQETISHRIASHRGFVCNLY